MITIPFLTTLHVVNEHEQQQNNIDISCDIKKCWCDNDHDKNKEDVASEIECLKKPCVEDT